MEVAFYARLEEMINEKYERMMKSKPSPHMQVHAYFFPIYLMKYPSEYSRLQLIIALLNTTPPVLLYLLQYFQRHSTAIRVTAIFRFNDFSAQIFRPRDFSAMFI